MTKWRIHYPHRITTGETLSDWLEAPSEGVQVLVLFRKPVTEAGENRWAHVTDRILWTGDDTYRLHDWPLKRGDWTDPETYARCWREARTLPP